VNSDGGVTAVMGEPITYTLAYSNVGNQVATGVVLTETLPANTSFNAAASTAGWAQAAPGSSVYRYSVPGMVAVAGSGSVTFVVNVSSALPASIASISNTATIADDGAHGGDYSLADNTSSVAAVAAVQGTAGNDWFQI